MTLIRGIIACCLIVTAPAVAQGRITKAELGTGATSKSEIVNPATEFKPDTPQIVCVWRATGVKPGTSMRGAWIAEDVGKAAPPNYKIGEETLKNGYLGSFTLSRPTKGFPAGKYRLELYLDGKLGLTVPFTVTSK